MQLKQEISFKSKHVRIVLLVSVLLLSLLLVLNAFRSRDGSPENAPEISNETLPWDFLPLDDITRIDFPNARIQLPEGWSITALLSSAKNTGYSCVGTTCRLAMLAPTTTESNLAEVVISTPTYARIESAPGLTKMTTVGILAGETITLNVDKSVTSNVSVSEDGTVTDKGVASEYVYQIYGCSSKDICVYVANLNEDLVINMQQVEELKKLIRELVILQFN